MAGGLENGSPRATDRISGIRGHRRGVGPESEPDRGTDTGGNGDLETLTGGGRPSGFERRFPGSGRQYRAELGDIRRFDNPKQLMCFLGLVPSEYSSGEKSKKGRITKTGNSHVRRILVECSWAYRFQARVAKDLRKRQQDLPRSVIDISWKAQLRLCKRYQTLLAKGKAKNKVLIAIARELCGFIWAIAREVEVGDQYPLAA